MKNTSFLSLCRYFCQFVTTLSAISFGSLSLHLLLCWRKLVLEVDYLSLSIPLSIPSMHDLSHSVVWNISIIWFHSSVRCLLHVYFILISSPLIWTLSIFPAILLPVPFYAVSRTMCFGCASGLVSELWALLAVIKC